MQVKEIVTGDQVTVGSVLLSFLWPDREFMVERKILAGNSERSVLGAQTEGLNATCLVFYLRYGEFDAFFPGV